MATFQSGGQLASKKRVANSKVWCVTGAYNRIKIEIGGQLYAEDWSHQCEINAIQNLIYIYLIST